MTITTHPGQILTPLQYEQCMLDPSAWPRTSELADAEVEFLVSNGMAKESALRPLAAIVRHDSAPIRGHIPFLLIPPRPSPINWNRAMNVVRLGDQIGHSHFFANDVRDLTTPPDGAYLLSDVEDGRSQLEEGHDDQLQEIRDRHRFGLTAFEAVILAAIFPVLSHHDVRITESAHFDRLIPLYHLRNFSTREVVPVMYDHYTGFRDARFGTPSISGRHSP